MIDDSLTEPVPKTPQHAGTSKERKLFQQASKLFKTGDLSAAEQLCRQLLKTNPQHGGGHCLLAELLAMSGRPGEAIDQLQSAIVMMPDDAQPRYRLGVLYLDQGAVDYAIHCSQDSIKLSPDFAEAYVLQGMALRRAARLTEAIDAYRQAIALRPDFTDAYYNLGMALTDLGRYREAIEQYRKLLAIEPDRVDAYHGLGLCMDWLGEMDEAAAYYERGLRLDPSHVGIWNNIASVYLAQNRLEKSLEAFAKSADLKFNHGRPINGPLNMILHRIRHDAEQLRYIDANGSLPAAYRDYLNALSELEAKHAGRQGTDRVVVDTPTTQRIASSFNRIVHRAASPAIAGGALNPAVDWAACETTYLNAVPEVVIIENFLRPEALDALRNYCLESTVWKTVRPYGYMGALITDGFATPLLLQIVTELRQRLPGILSEHHLTQAWAYKYDSSLSAINIHADCAAVNVNFWITPDEANKNPNNGGLVLWDKAPPPEWGLMRTQNPDKTEIKQFLDSAGARTITVPHRQNRMVLFNSALFHKSDDMEFRDGYENRRINVTLLYGNGLR